MLRLMRLSLDMAPANFDLVLRVIPELLESLHVTAQVRDLIARPELDGNECNFYTNLVGGVTPIITNQAMPLNFSDSLLSNAKESFHNRRAMLLGALDIKAQQLGQQDQDFDLSAASDPNIAKILATRLLTSLLEQCQYACVVDSKDVVILPFVHQDQSKVFAPVVPVLAEPSATATAATAWWSTLLWWLIGGLLLVAIVGAIWWFWFKDRDRTVLIDPNAVLYEQLEHDEALLAEINNQLEKVNERIAEAERLQAEKEAAQRAKIQELEHFLKQNEVMESEVQKLMTKVDARIAQAQQVKVEPKPETPPVETVTNTTKRLPKCSVIKQEGKLPHLIIAMDGSGSMITPMMDGKPRFIAANNAAVELVNSIDNNVPVRVIGINDCPLAQDYGVYTNRNSLAKALRRINPLGDGGGSTPLVSAMKLMSAQAPQDVESVGILITDGEDSCLSSSSIDVCRLAEEIHAQKPLFKLNVILMGDEAARAGCIGPITGGKTYGPQYASQVIENLKQAGQSLKRVCVP